jgi:ABC-type antimicrobial peptide transport system permease subunit
MGAAAVAVAILSVTTVLILLKDFDAGTESKIGKLENSSFQRMTALENEARVFTKSLGFNIFVYHREQDLTHFYAEDQSTHYLDHGDAQFLADSNFAYLNHLLPFLRHRYHLTEFGGEVIIAGLEGEIHIKRKFQAPLEVRIEAGQVQLGHAVATKLSKKTGDTIKIANKEYKVTHVRSQLGIKDDLMVFMNLTEAQELLNLQGKLSGILALSCNCAAGDIEPIRKGLKKLIPHAQVVEFAIQAKARQQARKAIKTAVRGEITDIMNTRKELRGQLQQFSSLFALVMVISASLLLFFLYAHNVKERRHEIAILRTVGVRVSKIFGLFIAKALVLALMGSSLGYVGAMLLGAKLSASIQPVWSLAFFGLLFGAAALVSVVASLLPTVVAARRDPSLVLNEED